MSTDLGKNVQSLSTGDDIQAVTEVIVQYGVDSSGNPLTKTATASPNNGRTVSVTVDHIAESMAQTVANNILSQFTGITYNSLTASGAELDPACELFDEVTVDSINTAIGSVDTTFNKAMIANIEAQGISEDDDFPFTSLIEKQVQRADTKADSAISGLSEKADTSSLAAGTTTINGACITTGTMAADRIKGGSLTLGGDNNENGQLFIKNSSNETIGTWNKDGIEITQGSIGIIKPPTDKWESQYFPLTKNSDDEYIVPYAVLKYYAGMESEALADLAAIGITVTQAEFEEIYDVNGDGEITASDAGIIQQWFDVYGLKYLSSYTYDEFGIASTTYVDPIGGKYVSVAVSMVVYLNDSYVAQYDSFSTQITPAGLYVSGNLMTDCVIANGELTSTATSTASALTWKYRKWKGGNIELWGEATVTPTTGINTLIYTLPSIVTGVVQSQTSFYMPNVPNAGYVSYSRARSDVSPYCLQESYITITATSLSSTMCANFYVLGTWS